MAEEEREAEEVVGDDDEDDEAAEDVDDVDDDDLDGDDLGCGASADASTAADAEVPAPGTRRKKGGHGGGGGGRRRKGAAAPGLRVNTVACTGKSAKDLFSAVAEHLGWREVDVEARPSAAFGTSRPSASRTIYCAMQSNDLLERLPLPSTSWVTRYAAMSELCDKGNLARIVLLCQDLVQEGSFAFMPRTWVLPEQLEALREAMNKGKSGKTYIVKPEDGSQGDGIFLVQGVRDLDVKLSCKANKLGVVQRYLAKPLLHRGLKFDFRIYVAVIGGSEEAPPRVFLCREGLARFCTEAYEEPSQKNLHKCMGHLTNYSLNKRSDRFAHSELSMDEVFSTETEASKRPLTVALRQIAEEYPDFDVEAFYASLADLVRSTAALMAPVLFAAGRGLHPGGRLRSCQLLGFDVMLDSKRAPYLLEVNNSPSLCIDEALPLDENELAELAAASAVAKPGGRVRTVAGDQACRCMDMVQPHRHRTSLVDLIVKRTAAAGLFQLLEQLGDEEGRGAAEHPDYFEVDLRNDPVFDLADAAAQAFLRAGGAGKAFTSAGLRRLLQPLCGQGALEKHDLDAMAPRFRASRFSGLTGANGAAEALRLFDYLDVVRQAAAKAFPGVAPAEAVQRAFAMLGQ